ncbi:MAG TPA: glycoside hydrolase family 2 TIM barrel-domain containing protein [Polyangiaceae bacterium]|jgi:beta-galactosidase|nr:glycoside hydrolase family 2 TIM barrel-domain containing protein [Polyangiaceae bacterium]
MSKQVLRKAIGLSLWVAALVSGCGQTSSGGGAAADAGASDASGGVPHSDAGQGSRVDASTGGGAFDSGGSLDGSPSGMAGADATTASDGAGGIDAAPDATIFSTNTPTTPAYNGLRGTDFGAGWEFNLGDVSGAQATSFDDSGWRSLDVPHDWSIELPFDSNSPGGSGGGFLDGGIGWYRKTFTLDPSVSGQRVLIDFDGVYMNSEVWINGTALGTRPYGYSSFEYDLTPYVTFGGSNVIAVRVDNDQPNSRWYSGSGIYRNVWLTVVNPISVPNSSVFVWTPSVSDASATVSVSTVVQNASPASAPVVLTTTVTDASGNVVATNDSAATSVAAGSQSTVQQSLTVVSPQRWSVASPYLYQVKVEVKVGAATVDTYLAPLGVRTATFDANTGFSLNGENMKIRGVCLHHDLGALGTALNYRALERQVQILKAMGANAIRTSHNPPAPELLDICDRLGVMVMEEAFDTWTQTKTANDYGNYFSDWAQRDLQGMVQRDRNHPSVIMWSIGNEVGGSTTTTAQSLKNWVLALDTTRPVTWASNKMGGPHVSEGDDRAVAALLDLVGYNYAPYAGDYDADHTANPTWKIFGSETTAAVRSRGIYHTPASTVTLATSQSSPDRQCSSYDNEAAGFGNTAESAYSYDNDRPFVAGSFVWSGFDYIGEPTPYSAWPSKNSYYGIVDTAGFPKDIYYFYQSRWTTTPMVHLLPHWNWTSGTSVTVYAYGNCDSVELFLNGQSQGAKTLSGGALHFEWAVPWAQGTLRADCTTNGSVVASDTVQTAGAAAKVVLTADRNPVQADGKDLVFVTADIEDANGVRVPTAANAVAFSISGPGQLVGLDNGNSIDTTSYKGTSRNAFSGKALAIVRTTKTAGAIVVTASSAGLTSEPVTVDSQ